MSDTQFPLKPDGSPMATIDIPSYFPCSAFLRAIDYILSSRMLKKARLLTRPTLAATSPARPESAKTASSPKDAPCPKQGHSSATDPRFTFHASRFTVYGSRFTVHGFSFQLVRWREHRYDAQRAAGPAGNFHRQGDHVESPMRKIA